MLNKIKKIASWTLGIPAAVIVCSDVQANDGVALQIVALAILGIVLFANGVFRKGESYGK